MHTIVNISDDDDKLNSFSNFGSCRLPRRKSSEIGKTVGMMLEHGAPPQYMWESTQYYSVTAMCYVIILIYYTAWLNT